RINAELANNIGNLVQRVLSFIYKNCDGTISNDQEVSLPHGFGEVIKENPINYKIAMDKKEFDRALFEIINLSSYTNEYLHQQAPWNLKKEGRIEEMNQALYVAAESIKKIAILLLPFIPNSTNKILDLLNIPQNQRNLGSLNLPLKAGHKINQPQ